MRSALLLVLVAGSLACTDGTRAGTPSSSQAAAEPVFVPPSLPWAYDRGFAPEGHGPDRPMLRNAEVAAKFVAALERDAPIVFTVPTDVLCEVAEVIANAKLGPSSVELYGDIVGVDPTCLAKLDPIYLSHYVGPRPDYEAEQRAFFELTRAVPQLRGLGFDGYGGVVHGELTLGSEDLERIAALPDLQALALYRVNLTPPTAQALARLPGLRSLELQDEGLTAEPIRIIADALELSRFGCERCEMGDAVMAEIAKFEHLRELLLDYGDLGDRGIEHLAVLSELEVVDLTGNRSITHAGVAHLAGLVHMRRLWLSDIPLDSEALPHLRRLIQLELLHLAGTSVSDENFEVVANMAELRELDLWNTKVTNAAVSQIANLRQLESLILSDTLIDSYVLASLEKLVELRKLNLANTNIDYDLQRLNALKKLESLDLSNTLVDDVALRQLSPPPSLREIDLSSSRVTEEMVDKLRSPTLSVRFDVEEEVECAG